MGIGRRRRATQGRPLGSGAGRGGGTGSGSARRGEQRSDVGAVGGCAPATDAAAVAPVRSGSVRAGRRGSHTPGSRPAKHCNFQKTENSDVNIQHNVCKKKKHRGRFRRRNSASTTAAAPHAANTGRHAHDQHAALPLTPSAPTDGAKSPTRHSRSPSKTKDPLAVDVLVSAMITVTAPPRVRRTPSARCTSTHGRSRAAGCTPTHRSSRAAAAAAERRTGAARRPAAILELLHSCIGQISMS